MSAIVSRWRAAAQARAPLMIVSSRGPRQPPPRLEPRPPFRRGTQYGGLALGHRLREAAIAASMGTWGSARDDAMADSFFAALETEPIDCSAWAGPAEARAAVFEYIEVFCNRIRRHSAIGCLGPAEFGEPYRSSLAVDCLTITVLEIGAAPTARPRGPMSSSVTPSRCSVRRLTNPVVSGLWRLGSSLTGRAPMRERQ
jgi:hypothetical protein